MAHAAWIALWLLAGPGVVLAIVAVLRVIRPLRDLLKRTETLQRAQLLIDIEQLKERSAELARISARVTPLLDRAMRARRSLEVSFRMLRLPEAVAAIRGAGSAIHALTRIFHSA